MITPREMLRDYMTVLNILMQNPDATFEQVVGSAVTLRPVGGEDDEADHSRGEAHRGTAAAGEEGPSGRQSDPASGGAQENAGRRMYSPDEIDI